MPIFEYICRECHHHFETIVTASRSPACPACASAELDRQWSVFAVSTGGASTTDAPVPCGTCGDPRGPGSCRLD